MYLKKGISILIPNYNGEKYLKNCLDSIIKNLYVSYEIIIYDNNSNDESSKILENYLKKLKGYLRIIYSNDNIGFGKAINKLVDEAKYEYVLILNNDTEVLRIDTLQDIVDRGIYKNYIVSPKILNYQNIEQFKFIRYPNKNHWLIFYIPFKKKIKKLINSKNNSIGYIPAVSWLIHKVEYKKINGFDINYKHYHEDCDFAFRFYKENKTNVLILEKDEIIHYGGGGADKISFFSYSNYYWGLIYYYYKNLNIKITKGYKLIKIALWMDYIMTTIIRNYNIHPLADIYENQKYSSIQKSSEKRDIIKKTIVYLEEKIKEYLLKK